MHMNFKMHEDKFTRSEQILKFQKSSKVEISMFRIQIPV